MLNMFIIRYLGHNFLYLYLYFENIFYMRFLLTLTVVFILSNCNPQNASVASVSSVSQKTSIDFEDIYHYPYNLISGNFQIIESQQQMDQIFKIIHKNNGGNRMAPIPTITEDETYIIFKPTLKNTNDVEIKEIFKNSNGISVSVEPLNNPDIAEKSRVSPNVLVKLLGKVSAKKINVIYQQK